MWVCRKLHCCWSSSQDKNQVPKAVIVLKNGVKDTFEVREAIRKYCRKNIAKYAQPKEFEFRDSIPKTAIGKVAYRDLENKKITSKI